MRFAACNEFFEKWELEQVFKFCSKIGYDGVEISPFTLSDSVSDISSSERRRIGDLAQNYNLDIVGVHWLLVKPEGLYINHPDKEIRDRTRDYFHELINFCADIGGRTMVIGSPKQKNIV